jgi:primosomal protein N' (replication factor Y)
VLRVPRVAGAELSRVLGQLQRARSVKKLPPIRVQVDPVSLG